MHQWLTKLPITHLCHIKERNNSPSPGSQLSKSEYRCAFSPSSCVFCPQSICCVLLSLSLRLCLHPFASDVFPWQKTSLCFLLTNTESTPWGKRGVLQGIRSLAPTNPNWLRHQCVSTNSHKCAFNFYGRILESCFQHLSLLLAANDTYVLSGGGLGGVHMSAMH